MARREETPITFEPHIVELPSREEMLDALETGLHAILFKVSYLGGEHDVSDAEHHGGMQRFAPEVAAILDAGADLAKMYVGLYGEPKDAE